MKRGGPLRDRLEAGRQAIAVPLSANRKIGACATTYVEQRSCPTSCVFYGGGGCYAEEGQLGKFVTSPLNKAAAERPFASRFEAANSAAHAEAAAIDAMTVIPGRPLRLHTVGDCATALAAFVVGEAATRYRARGGGPVWTYTHAWRDVPRAAWGDVSVLASCETAEDVTAAQERGYATAVVVEHFPSRNRYQADRLDVVPCPAQTSEHVTCADCRLCMDDAGLRTRGYSIGFAIHGTPLTVKRAMKALNDPDDPERRLSSRDHALEFERGAGRLPSTAELQAIAGVNQASAHQMLARMKAERAS